MRQLPKFLLSLLVSLPTYAIDPEIAEIIAKQKERMRTLPGFYELRDGTFGTMNVSTCQIELLMRARTGEFADFADFFAAGGQGTIVRVSTLDEQMSLSSDYGVHLEITKLPKWTACARSSSLFLRDRRTYDMVAARLAKGTPVFLRPEKYGYIACVVDSHVPLMSGMFLQTKNQERYHDSHALILTRDADLYTVIHEEKHLDDMPMVKEMSKAIMQFLEQAPVLKIFNPFRDGKPIVEFILEQRADVARFEETKRDAEQAPESIIAIRTPNTERGVTEITMSEYLVRAKADIYNRLSARGEAYGKLLNEHFKKLRAADPKLETQLRGLVKGYCLASEEFSFDALMPPSEK